MAAETGADQQLLVIFDEEGHWSRSLRGPCPYQPIVAPSPSDRRRFRGITGTARLGPLLLRSAWQHSDPGAARAASASIGSGGLADVFIDAVKRRRIQIIFESHSEHLLERLQLRLAEEKFKPADTALYFCENDDGVSTLHRLKVDIFGNITNWPPGFFGDPFHESAIRLETEMTRRIAGKSKLRQ